MKLAVISTALLMMSSPVFAAQPLAHPVGTKPPVGRVVQPLTNYCGAGFQQNIKESNPATGRLSVACRADVRCPGQIAVGTSGTSAPTVFFEYTCTVSNPIGFPTCSPGFAVASALPGKKIDCRAAPIICPSGLQMTNHLAIRNADLASGYFEYQCYRPGA